MLTVPTTEPDAFIAGDTVKWTRALAEFPPSEGWTLTYHLRGPKALDVAATVDGSSYSVTIAAAQSVCLDAGTYEWLARVKNGAGEAYTADRGSLVVKPNLQTAAAGERVSHAEKMLAAIEAVLEGRIPADVQQYNIGMRSILKIPVLELRQLRRSYAAEVKQQRNPGQIGRSVGVTFVRT